MTDIDPLNAGYGLYIARRKLKEISVRTWLYDVAANNSEEALELLNAGKGKRYAYVSEESYEVIPLEEFSTPRYDFNEGMGR